MVVVLYYDVLGWLVTQQWITGLPQFLKMGTGTTSCPEHHWN